VTEPPRQSPEEKETARVEAFSDGVFAIAITLLVLELKVPPFSPDAALLPMLAREWPSYLAYLTSFTTIGIMWINHHRIFMLMRRVDHLTLVLNGTLLMGVSIVPFPTSLVASRLGHPGQRLAVMVYAAVGVYIAVAFTLLWRYVSSSRRHPPLMRVAHDSAGVKALHKQYRYGPLTYTILLALAYWHASLAMALCLGLALFFLLPEKIFQRE
jgi:uncharacterized membrane protein